jgi:hypothetical protein
MNTHPDRLLTLCLALDVLNEERDGALDGQHVTLGLDDAQLHERTDDAAAVLPVAFGLVWLVGLVVGVCCSAGGRFEFRVVRALRLVCIL